MPSVSAKYWAYSSMIPLLLALRLKGPSRVVPGRAPIFPGKACARNGPNVLRGGRDLSGASVDDPSAFGRKVHRQVSSGPCPHASQDGSSTEWVPGYTGRRGKSKAAQFHSSPRLILGRTRIMSGSAFHWHGHRGLRGGRGESPATRFPPMPYVAATYRAHPTMIQLLLALRLTGPRG